MATLVCDDLWFCDDCTMVAVNDDASGIESERRERAVRRGLSDLQKDGSYAVPNYDSETGEGEDEFSWSECDCCGTSLGGRRTRFSLLK
jgi:hypothetical protein